MISNPQSTRQNPVLVYGLGLLGVTIFGATLPATTLALESFDPGFITVARAMLATLGAALWLALSKRALFTPHGTRLFFIGALLVYGFPGFMALALQTVPAAHGGVVLGLLPLFTAILARIIAEEQPSLFFWLIATIGASVVAVYAYYHAGDGADPGFALGDLWLLIAGLCAALGYVLSGKLAKTMPGHEVICRALLCNGPITVIALLWLWNPAYTNPSPTALGALLYLGFFSMLIGFFAWNTALAWGGIARMGQLQLLQIFVTIALSAMLLNEPIGPLTLITAIIVTGLIALSRRV